jgi:hypothetical protein
MSIGKMKAFSRARTCDVKVFVNDQWAAGQRDAAIDVEGYCVIPSGFPDGLA